MALPKLAIPEYECELPVSNLKVKYRPFLVKEEKLLYLAMESQKEKEMVNAVKTIIKNCTDLKANLNKIPTFEIEYL
ncbi:MAG: baseplate protein, partial [Pseudomonadota bacterium]|nr:baseplate protein [Pseudomonadota bacterium]